MPRVAARSGRTWSAGCPHHPRRDRSPAARGGRPVEGPRTGRAGRQRLPSRGRLLVGGLRRAHGPRARPQGHALSRAAARGPGPGVPRAGPRRRRTGGELPADGDRAADLPHSSLGDAGELLDARAKDAYRRRLAEIDDDIAEAHTLGDDERAARSDAERNFLVQELARAFGLGGRGRRAASASERARAGVTSAVRHAIARIGETPPPARRAPRAHDPHRHVLRLRSRPPRACRLAPVTSSRVDAEQVGPGAAARGATGSVAGARS